jgi:hypothetical protein
MACLQRASRSLRWLVVLASFAAGACGGGADGRGAGGAGGRGGAGGGGGGAGTTGEAGAIGAGGTSLGGTGGASGTTGAADGGGASGTTGSAGRGGGGGTGGGGVAGGDGSGGGGRGGSGGATASAYDQAILADGPVGYWAMNKSPSSEPDLTGHTSAGTYHGGTAPLVALPNGDQAADFNGSNQYMSIPSNAAFSIPTTHSLTWEAWIRPDTLQFPRNSNGYVDWMGKCQDYSPTCEWEARLYNTTSSENRCNRFSAYVFNPGADLGSGAFWQPTCGLIQAAQWYHVVGEYTTLSQPSGCQNASQYPGSVNIWLNGVPWKQSSHGQTGCFSQYSVVPVANDSPLNVGTMAMDAWFAGAIGKVAIYDKLLSQAQITSHYTLMTGKAPTGSCADDCSF